MSDILLTHGYFLHEDEKEQQIMRPYPTLGLLYLAAYLRRDGVDAEIFDTTFATRPELLQRLAAEPGGILGIYTNLMTRPSVLAIIAAAKDLGWTVILGGPESAGYLEEYLDRGADVIVVGEGDLTLSEVLPALAARGPHRLHDVLGTVFRDEDGRTVTNPARPQIADLDSLPWPARELIDQKRYIDVWREHHGLGSVSLITARGCPYRCRWCSHGVYGFTHRRRSVRNCADEIQHIVERYRPDQVWYADDVFTINHRWIFEYAAELSRRGLRVPFETISRADRLLKDEVWEALVALGCYRIWIGSESGSQKILDAMSRGVTVEQVQQACRAAKRHGIQVGMFLMWGYEGETAEDIEATIDQVKRWDPEVFLTTVSYPIKGTAYYNEVSDRVLVRAKDWDTATDRDHAIRGRHSRAYYKQADSWLREEVAAHRLAGSDPSESAQRREAAERARRAMFAASAEVEC